MRKTKQIWPDNIRLGMIEKSEGYSEPKIYQYGYFDGFQKGINMEITELIRQTDNTRTIPVNVYDAKVFITKIQSQIEILEMVNKHDEAKHWKTLLKSANELLNLNS